VSGALSKKAASLRAWREANPAKVAVYNERRREEYQRATAADRIKACLRCGGEFMATHANTLRCPPCQQAVNRARDAARKRRKRARQRELVA
jgi:ribosomal protein S27AE